MNQTLFRILVSIIVLASVLSGALLVTAYQKASRVTPQQLRNDALFVYDDPITLNAFSLTKHTGGPFTNTSLQGSWTLVFFGYTFCPDICPITMVAIKQFYDLLEASGEGENVQVVMISVDPERDTEEVLKNYVTYFNPEFIGARGDYSDVYQLARNVNLTFAYTRVDDDNYLVNHNGEIMVMGPTGDNVGFLKAPYEPQRMLENFLALKSFSESQR